MGTHVHGVISFEMTPSQDFAIEKATQTNFLSKLPCSEGLFWIFLCIFGILPLDISRYFLGKKFSKSVQKASKNRVLEPAVVNR